MVGPDRRPRRGRGRDARSERHCSVMPRSNLRHKTDISRPRSIGLRSGAPAPSAQLAREPWRQGPFHNKLLTPTPDLTPPTDQELIARWRGEPAPLLPLLHAFHDRDAHLSEPALRQVAEALGIPLADPYG